MSKFMCVTCGTQFPESENPSADCPICEDERQYVNWAGQQWITLEKLQKTHQNKFVELEANLTAIGTETPFAINQHAILLQHPAGNILWDCISLIDDATIERVNELGGISKIAISHPHYYSSMIEWADAFDTPIYIHADERQWVMQPSPRIEFWEGETLSLRDDVTLIRCGGHYSGGQVLHWADTSDQKGALLAGDIIQVVQDRSWVSFMYSYPNLIPLSKSKVQKIVDAVEPYSFDRLYSPWWNRHVLSNAKNVVKRSAERYIRAIEES